MSDDSPRHPCELPVDELLRDCEIGTTRRSGPGGQHRNKTESAVVIAHRPTGITGQASERRSQAENRQQAVKRLRIQLALDVRLPELGDRGPTPLWRSRCREGKIRVNPDHADFPELLAQALDVVSLRRGHLARAAEQLTCTTSQLCKLLQLEPRAWQLVNAWRRQAGLPPWK